MPTDLEPVPVPVPQASPERRAKVDAARAAWIRKLIDTSRRNNLLYYRDLKTGTLDLSGAAPAAMTRLLSGDEVPLAKLLPAAEREGKVAEARMIEIRSRAQMNSEERGIETLFMAMGMASWDSSDGERPPEAAILLVPIQAVARGRRGAGISLKRAGDIQANLVLLHMLEDSFGIEVNPDDLLNDLQGDDEGEAFDFASVTARLTQMAGKISGFKTSARLVVGNFAFQKTAMVRDLRECAEQMAMQDLIAAIAGDAAAAASLREHRESVAPGELDVTAPDDEFLFLDADSSQQLVIRQALAHQDGTIQGPPGTGKSQTIANLIAEYAARGKRVLFVAEKRAALEVVLDRLKKKGLDHLALDLHGADLSRRDVMVRLQQSLDLVASTPPLPDSSTHSKLTDRRARLVAHVTRMHGECVPTHRSVYEIQGRLLTLGPETLTRTRWRAEALDAIGAAQFEHASDLLSQASSYRDLFLRCSSSPWNGAQLINGESVRDAMAWAAALPAHMASFETALAALCQSAAVRVPASLRELAELLALLREVRGTLEAYRPELFAEGKLADLLQALEPATHSAIARAWAYVSSGEYRGALRMARAYRQNPRASATVLHAELSAAAAQATRWAALSATPGGVPQPVPALAELEQLESAWMKPLRALWPLLQRGTLEDIALTPLRELLAALAADRATPPLLPKLCAIESSLAQLGVQSLIDELREVLPEAGALVPRLEHAWLMSALERARENDPDLAGFMGRAHDSLVAEFRLLDQQRIAQTVGRIRRTHAERAVAVMNEFPDEAELVRAECQRKARGRTIRNLVAAAPNVLTALRPCWMASPLSVSQLLPAERKLFDLVLFDEASQVLPEDAMPALMRAERAVVAGDRQQLPPTTFFAAGDEADPDAESDSPVQGFESILDQMAALFAPWTLDWHYRSRDESLISFSNRHIYGDRLITFPGPGLHQAIQHHLVTQEASDGQEDSVSAEVSKVVELILKHATERATETLGVIALGIKHQKRIEAALEVARRERPELDEFFSESQRERFFVKNLERVQGDERDAIILTVGYGKDRSGKLPYRFGPLLYEGGERRLNVAITRARNRMTIVSAFNHHDMDPGRSKARGVELLRLYLEFAVSGGRHLGDAGASAVPLNEFEQDVFDALSAKHIPLQPQWGASRYRIDMVAQHPSQPGRLVLAIECDGASYHSAQSARDRDRLRQQHLEALGWRFHRIWSTDWFVRREEEIARAVEAYEAAVEAADRAAEGGGAEAVAAGLPAVAAVPVPPTGTALKRSPAPVPSGRGSIDQYTRAELIKLVRWIKSDGLLRTDQQILDAAVEHLGFARKGARIVASLRGAIAAG